MAGIMDEAEAARIGFGEILLQSVNICCEHGLLHSPRKTRSQSTHDKNLTIAPERAVGIPAGSTDDQGGRKMMWRLYGVPSERVRWGVYWPYSQLQRMNIEGGMNIFR